MTYLFQFLKKCRTTPDTINSWENLFCGEIDDHHCRGVRVQNVFFIRALLGFKDSNNVTLTLSQHSIEDIALSSPLALAWFSVLIIYMMNEFSTNRNNCDHSNHWSFIVHMN
jgi:hypothetical protein